VNVTQYLSKDFLARGHLAPAGDFALGAWQVLTYFYINAAPQWQSINDASWLTLEKFIRKMAIQVSIH
jgi:DNA/RNA endonuclease G (NUC1)